jgi:UDP-glucose 4-epimerase
MKIVITGALGHIGSKLIRELPSRIAGAEFVLVDDLSAQRYCSLFNLPAGVDYHFYERDILKADLRELFAGADVVVHLAAVTNAAESFKDPKQVELVNYIGTEKVAQACADVNSPLIFLSSTSVYGTQNDVVDEDCSLDELKPQSPYAESKLKAENLLSALGERNNLHFVMCRFGTIFGVSPGMRFHTAVNKFCWQAVTGQPVTVWKTALHQRRPYLDLNDAVDALALIINKSLYDRRVYNVLTSNATVNDIVTVISKYVPDLQINFVDTAIMNQLSYHVSMERFRKIGFECKGDLETGIRQTIDLLKGVRRWVI